MKILFMGILFLAAGLARASDELPLTRVILFNSGVGYFERDAEIEGDATIRLSFPVDQVNDFIKSVVVMDEGRGTPHLSYESRDPVERTLKTFAVDLSDNVALHQLLENVRGAPVRLTLATRSLEGRIVSVESRVRHVESERFTEHILNLDTDDGLRSISLDHVEQVRFLDERLEADLKEALDVLAQRLDRQRRQVALRLPGEDRRAVWIGYILETPVWKTSYRLVLNDEDEVFLQGWAHVENMSDDDWRDIRLELVSGQPISFIQNLYDPIYIQRPVIDPTPDALQVPEEHDAVMRLGVAAPEGARPARMRGLAAEAVPATRPPRVMDLERIEAAAEAAPTGELFSYNVRDPVSLSRQQSMMIPILQAPLEGAPVSLFNRDLNERHPLNAVELRNVSDTFLMRGPVTVFEDNLYAGEGRLPNVPPGEDHLVSYAVDLALEVRVDEQPRPQRIESMRIVQGVLHVQHRQQKNYDYIVRNKRDHERALLLEHPIRPDWEISGPHEDPESTREHYRYRVMAPPRESQTYRMTEHRITHQSVELINVAPDRIRFYLRQKEISDALLHAMEEIARRQMEIADIQREIADIEKEIGDITRDQARIREHLKVIDRASDAFKRWQQQLLDQEETVQERHQRLRDRREAEREKQGRLDEFIAELNVE